MAWEIVPLAPDQNCDMAKVSAKHAAAETLPLGLRDRSGDSKEFAIWGAGPEVADAAESST